MTSNNTNRKKLGNDFTEGNLTKLLITFMLPFLLANLLTNLYNVVDMIIIGQFVGSAGIVSVTMGGKVMTLCTGIAISLSSGGQVYLSQLTGAKSPLERQNTVTGTLVSAMFLIALAFSAIGLLFPHVMLGWMNTPGESIAASAIYMRITCLGLPMVFVYTTFSAVLRAIGDSTRPLVFVAIAAVTNLVLDILLVGGLHMGVAGAAIATVIGQALAFLFSVIYLYRHRDAFVFDFRPRSFRIDRRELWVMMKIGIPMALQTVLIQGTQLVMISFINALGLVSAAVYSISTNIVTMSNIVDMSINSAGGAVVAQNIGAGKYDRARETIFVALRVTIAFAGLVAIPSMLWPRALFGIFSRDEAVLAYAPEIMRISTFCYFLAAIMGSFNIMTSGTGAAGLGFLAGILDGVVFRFGFCWLFGMILNMGVTGYFLGNTLARFGPLIVHSTYFFSGAWTRRKRLTEA